MSTATKLEYLNETKSKLKDNINLTGAGLTNQTPFRQYATDLKTALLNILNNGTDVLYNNFPKTTGTGTNITLNNTLQAPIRSVINGDTEQDSYSGKNLLNWTLPYTIQNAGNIILSNVPQLEVGESYYFVGKCSDGTILSSANCSCVWYSGSTQILNKPPRTTFTATDISSASGFYIYVTSALVGKTISEFMLIKGTFDSSNIPSYEPYTGGTASPNPDYPQEIKSVTGLQKDIISGGTETTPQEYEINLGKNLLKFPYAESTLTRDGITYTINNDGSISISGTATATSYINLYSNLSTNLLEKGKTYTYSISPENSNIRLTVLERYNNTWNENGFGTNKITFTISNNSEGQLIRLIVTNGSTIDTTISPQIEKGTQATTPSPYFTPIHLYENDQIIGKPYNWSIKHVMGEVVLDGTNKSFESKHATISSETKGFYKTSLPNKNETYDNGSTGIAFSDYFSLVSGTANNAFNNNDNGMWWQKTGETVYFILEETSLADANAWLQTHNTKVVYPLAEPTTEPITNTELIEDLNNFYNKAKSYNGQTNISVEGDLPMILDVSAIIGDE